jgi:hypothetical protein
MTDLLKAIQELNIEPSKLMELATAMKENPFAAMAKIQELGIAPDALQKVMAAVMANPGTVFELAKQFGLSDEMLEAAKKNFPGQMGQ